VSGRTAPSKRRRGSGGEGSTVALSTNGKRALTVYFGAFLIFLYLPSFLLILFSFNDDVLPQFPIEGFTFAWYEEAWNTEPLREAFKNSIIIAVACALLSPAVALLAAYPIARRKFRGRNIVTAVMLLPLVVPLLVLGIALLMLTQKGPVHVPLGIWPTLLGHIVISIPYAMLLLVPRIAGIDRRLEEAAQDLGASGAQTFRRIILPLITPALLSAVLISFVVSIDEVAIASFLTGNSPTYPMFLYQSLRFVEQLPRLLPPAALMIVISFGLVILAEWIRRRGERRLGLQTGVGEPAAPAPVE
jgi:spermidine/putrescine transport system permease protein